MNKSHPIIPPLCKDCKHYQRYNNGYEVCGLRAKKVNPVDGGVIDDYYQRNDSLCSKERFLFWPFSFILRRCGKRGRFFESRQAK